MKKVAKKRPARPVINVASSSVAAERDALRACVRGLKAERDDAYRRADAMNQSALDWRRRYNETQLECEQLKAKAARRPVARIKNLLGRVVAWGMKR